MKKILLPIIAAAALTAGATVYADGVIVTVNGTRLDTEAQIVNDRTMIPLRAVSNALGCGIAWNSEDKGITIYRAADGVSVPDSIVMCWIDKDHAFRMDGYALGGSIVMDTPPLIINDRTYVPVRSVAELLGAEVEWEEDTRTAVITGTVTEGATDEFTESLIDYERAMLNMYQPYCDYVDGTIKTENIEITLANGGKIDVELYPELAPVTVNNFITLADADYYNGLIFHRVIEGFMIQGGGFDADGSYIQTQNIRGEFLANGVFNIIPHDRGVISMARAQSYNSGSGQFFIMHADYPYLNGEYAAFGKVISGMEYVDAIALAETDENDKPLENQIIERIEVVR